MLMNILCMLMLVTSRYNLFVQVNHLEPWEKGSRKTAGQTGMCGGVSITVLNLLIC